MGNFNFSPGTKFVDGLSSVPIHITQLNATVTFNGSTKTTEVVAVLEFEVGPNSGYPTLIYVNQLQVAHTSCVVMCRWLV